MVQEEVELVRRAVQAANRRDIEAVEELVSEDLYFESTFSCRRPGCAESHTSTARRRERLAATQPIGGFEMWGTSGAKLGAVALATLVIGIAACGDDGDDETTAPEAANGNARPGARDLDRFLMRKGEEPGFRPGAAPGALPRSRETITGVKAFVKDSHLTQADARRLRSEGFISFTFQPIRGPRTAGVTNVALFATAEGAQHHMAHELRPNVIRAFGPVANLRYFPVAGIPGARGWTASLPGEPASHDVGNLHWVQGRCMLVLGNQGPGPFAGPLSTGARAIYERTNGQCP
jgi:hypothetical protein